jgi:hypothetical protein
MKSAMASHRFTPGSAKANPATRIAVTYLGVRSGDMLLENASALVGAAVLSVAVFPILAIVLRSKSDEGQPEGTLAIATHRLAGLASAQFSRFLDFVSQKTWGKP